MRHFARAPEVSRKDDGTLVTAADREIEQALRKRIADVFPGHAVLGEESGLAGDPSAPIWIIDPIDGTNNFAWGIPIFATLVGLRVGGRTKVGVAAAPALRERYEAARGDGARMNGAPIHVSGVSQIAEARICYSSLRSMARRGLDQRWASVLERCRRARGFGDFWGHMLVARGAADVMAEPELAIWDVAPLEVIVEEAGGRITTFSGEPYPNSRISSAEGDGSCLTTNELLHDQLVAELSGSSA